MEAVTESRAPEVDAPASEARPARRPRGLTFEQLALGALFVMLFARAAQAPAQNDTWWHLRAGQDIWRGVLPTVERWTFTARGRAWPDHEWLSEAIFYLLHRVGGMPMLAFLVACVTTATFALVWRLMVGPVLRRGLLVFLTLPVTLIMASLRPQVFSLLLLVVTVTLLARARFAWLPLVFLLWANLHGAVVIGGVVVAAVAVTALVWERARLRSVLIWGALAGVATFVTPLGVGIVGLVFGMSNEADIIEWEPAWKSMPAGLVFGAVALLTAVAVWAIARRRAFAWSDRVLVASAVAILPLAVRYSRVMPMFVVVALPLLARGWEAWRPARARPDDGSVLHTVVLGVVVVVAIAWVGVAWSGPSASLDWQPVSASAIAAVRACNGPLYNTFDDGAYLLWYAPDVPVFIDSRVDPFPDAFLRAHIRNEATGHYRATFVRYGITCAFLPQESATARALHRDGWRVTYADDRWVVLSER